MSTTIRGVLILSAILAGMTARAGESSVFRAGAAVVDVSPTTFPVIVNGGFLQATANSVRDPLSARCVVLDDGSTRLAIVVVDSCMMPRELIDEAKGIAARRTGIAFDRMLVSATHTHTAPSVMGVLGTPLDPSYAATLPAKIAQAIEHAAASLAPAEAGWGVVDDPDHTHTRRWIRRPDRMIDDPFGVKTVRANMHPGYENPDVIAPSGPSDPALTVLMVREPGGRPIAVLANYSMHYHGSTPVSADYYGRFASSLAKRLAPEGPAPVCIMSQGTSGDQQWMDYGRPKADPGLDAFADQVAESALRAVQSIQSFERPSLAMAETTLTLHRRTPDAERLEWARKTVAAMGDRQPRTIPEVYAREAVLIHDAPERTLKLQAVRVGALGIVAIPNEVYALTGLKLKARGPLPLTMNIELANGAEGYIPPPEQHALGGYTTWPARTASLEVQAEPRIVEAALGLLERVAGRSRRREQPPATQYAQAVLASRPTAFWRLDEMDGASALDATGHEWTASRRGGVALFLPGPDLPGFRLADGRIDRSNHLAGGAITASLPLSAEVYSIDFWFWNGYDSTHPFAGVLFERGREGTPGDAVGLTGRGTGNKPHRIMFTHGNPAYSADGPTIGKTDALPRVWHHLALVRQGRRVRIYLNGELDLEADADSVPAPRGALAAFTLGDRADHENSLEGKLDEVAVYDRALSASEVAEHARAGTAPIAHAESGR